ncbi:MULTISPECIES: tetracycline resistance ribosomal protection protein Otr(A) [unclassified Streptomyces]|uniref:tetracycline resistance ribosomal protection protein Otr(A) n=1 Tax=unclassified Streptomyces TaxID=2593676 RepID=UPI00088A4B31|nr:MULTISPECIES: tetracycline resistance ribosomal protection protein Otr(A) [unclassified Streptomyces]PBC85660.1 ribosomal protection tetracycline resistance protein [Streptomyces sp. 2321.6]SDR09292.1 ribosomal protection tetracycline resistance protein [Streptomyces sp. KS_16]SED75240.1 ribosomal protection tetracycline resistance protein [Streptomyces sp. 2133.1]SNC72426.1 ribosomal protection tetracycline resistance protein [Streptomyces sp. 2114.4]
MLVSHTLNIGILAHVDAGKTSLTERLLFDTGAIDRLGSVDGGDTRTDTGELERRRGITIRSAVASFTVGEVQINLIDTPGHADFIAEVERAVGVLDGAVLLLSAVEGVQAGTRVLMRTLRRLRLPTLLFLNKIDRAGARDEALLADIRRLLTPAAVPMTSVTGLGTAGAEVVPYSLEDARVRERIAEVVAEVDESILAQLVDPVPEGRERGQDGAQPNGPGPTADRLRAALAARTADGSLHPVYFGSALGGQGVGALIEGMVRLIPPAPAVPGATARGTVFAVQQPPNGERTAHIRLYGGELRPRQQVELHRPGADGPGGPLTGRITALQVVGRAPGDGGPLTPGNIGVVRGLPGVRTGDRLGPATEDPAGGALFAAPTLETLVSARRPAQAAALRAALLALADQDPLLRARPAPDGATSVLLHGEVQKEIIAATLCQEHGIEAEFAPSRVVCVERPSGVGEACHEIARRGHTGPWATVGLRVEPGARGSGPVFTYETELGALPHGFHQAVEETALATLRCGPHGWAVTDCRVVLTRSGFVGPLSTAGDFRTVTASVLARALRTAGTRVHEPYHAFEAEVPLAALAAVTARLAALGAEFAETTGGRHSWLVSGALPARLVQEFQGQLPGLTHGEGVWTSYPSGDRPVRGDAAQRGASG